jgi:DNA integrity scanning protein DisA with diadenylate cyclase activity
MCKVKNKHRSIGLFKHILVHLLLTFIALFFAGVGFGLPFFSALFIIIVSHYLIDIWKTYQSFELRFFLADQLAHFAVIVAISLWLNELTLNAILQSIDGFISTKVLMIVCAFVIVCKPASLVISLALKKYTAQFDESEKANDGLATAGELIGYFERGLILSFILIGQFSGVGFLLAAKSVFRFGDMRRQTDRKLTEYIMLGTLFSFSFAIAIGKLAEQLWKSLS